MSSYSIDLFGRNLGIIYVQLVSREGFIRIVIFFYSIEKKNDLLLSG